jgi:C4-dicarboxylate transporter, DctM subunit
VVLPFVGILALALVAVSYVPWFSNVAVAADVAAVRAKAEKEGIAPRDAWMLECVQEDPSNPQPCSPAEILRYPGGQLPSASTTGGKGGTPEDNAAELPDAGCNPDFDDCSDAGKKK